MPWADEVDAIIVVGLPGQEGGHAVADALLGVREPAGRLVTSWPAADGAAPAWEVEPTDLQLDYTDGTFVGYRGFHAGRADAPGLLARRRRRLRLVGLRGSRLAGTRSRRRPAGSR